MNLAVTEKRNEKTKSIDLMPIQDILKVINDEDKKVALAVENCLPEITKAVDIIVENFKSKGRLLYFGAGTSGRLGVLDASECWPTFGVEHEMVIGSIAGGDKALRFSVENAEDSREMGIADLLKLNPTQQDTVVGISAGGGAAYVLALLEKAQKKGIKTIGICSNPDGKMKAFCDVFINPVVGQEVLTGSSRMKSGSAQKMILNMLSTASMIKLGKTYGNLMIDVRVMNEKLKDRACRIICDITNASYDEAQKALQEASAAIGQPSKGVPVAVVMCAKKCSAQKAIQLLNENDNIVRKVL